MLNIYLIEYVVYDKDNRIIKEGTIRVKNQPNDFIAKVKLEKYLQKKYNNFGSLYVKSCTLDIPNLFGSSNMFKDIFGF